MALRQAPAGDVKNPRNLVERRPWFGWLPWLRGWGAVAKHVQRKGLLHHLAHPALRLDRAHSEDRGAGGEYLDQRKAQPAHLVFHGPLDGARRLHDLPIVAQSHALDVDRSLERGQQLADVQRIAFVGRAAPPGSGRALLSQQGGRRHLSAGHAVDGVVHEDDRNVLATIGRVQNLRRADGRQIPIALVADDDALRTAPLHAGGHGRRTPMRGRDIAHVEVVVGEDAAAHRANQDGFVLNLQIVDGPRQHLMHLAVAAAGAEVRLVLQILLALEALVK